MSNEQHPASFRDPSGFLFRSGGHLYRQVNQRYAAEYNRLMESGLYEVLKKKGRLVAHTEVGLSAHIPEISYKVIQPEKIPFISYPYEWSFSQLKEAALITLLIQKRAIEYGMSLKDASGYNIQFNKGKAVLIDTLSFEFYREGEPWIAYKQFCQHFLAPLALMAKKDIRLSKLLLNYIDGIPLELTSKLLPNKTKMNIGLLMHIHLHALAQTKFSGSSSDISLKKKEMSKQSLLGLIDSLKNLIEQLSWKSNKTEWGNYYDNTNYTDTAFLHKKSLVIKWVKQVEPKEIWDLGANNGAFSRLVADQGIFTLAFDKDPVAVEKNQLQVKANKEVNVLPLVLDIANPSAAIGWNNNERESFVERGPTEMIFAFALIHHLAISNNVPLTHIATLFGDLGKWLIVEFVPKSDSQVKKLLQSREDIFDEYYRENFERVFEQQYLIHAIERIEESERYLYLMEKR